MDRMDKEVEREDGHGASKGVKLGLALIAVLAMVLVGVLVMKFSGPSDTAVASGANHQAAKAPRNSRTGAFGSSGQTWGKRKPRSSSLDNPTVVSPKPAKSRLSSGNRPKPRSVSYGGASAEMSMMPDASVGSSPAYNMALMPAPSSYGSSTASSYPSYPASASSSSNVSSSQSTASTESNPLRGRHGEGHHRTSYPSYGTSSQKDSSYASGRYGSGTGSSAGYQSYEQAPYSPKAAGSYPIPNRVTSSYDSGSSYRRKSKSYGNDPYGSRSATTISGLGVRREDGKYVVAPNDSFATISERLYGTDAYFKALAEWNRTKFPDEDQLRVGDVISAPEESELLDKYPDLCPSPERRDVIRSRISAVSTGQGYRTGPTYTVQAGDTLFDIARYKLGNGARWPDIYELNSDVLQGDFNYVTPGMVLALPEEASDTVTRRPASMRAR